MRFAKIYDTDEEGPHYRAPDGMPTRPNPSDGFALKSDRWKENGRRWRLKRRIGKACGILLVGGFAIAATVAFIGAVLSDWPETAALLVIPVVLVLGAGWAAWGID